MAFEKGHRAWCKGLTKETNESVRRKSEAMIGHKAWNKGLTKETDSRVKRQGKRGVGVSANLDKHLSEVTKRRIGKSQREWWRTQPEERERRRKRMKALWRDSEWREEMFGKIMASTFSCSSSQPNKSELQLFRILESILPGDYALNVAANVLILGRKVPDFVNVNGRKAVIELYGERWHKPEDAQKRIDYFKKFGYKTLIIWSKELKDEERLVNKIKKFSTARK